MHFDTLMLIYFLFLSKIILKGASTASGEMIADVKSVLHAYRTEKHTYLR